MNVHLFTIQAAPVFLDNDDPKNPIITWIAGAAIDGDGTGPSHGDPDYQNDTSLHEKHAALNADEDLYVVVPPEIRDAVEPPVLGCSAHVAYAGKGVHAVVGDIGPASRIGEISIALAKALGIASSPTTGGVPEGVKYTIYPGQPANVNGKQYDLQTAKGVEIPTESSSSSEEAQESSSSAEDLHSTFDPVHQESSSGANP